jgi:hypothetical protein
MNSEGWRQRQPSFRLFGSSPRSSPTRPVIPEGHPGLGLFPGVLVLERFLEGSSSITLEGRKPAKAINYLAFLSPVCYCEPMKWVRQSRSPNSCSRPFPLPVIAGRETRQSRLALIVQGQNLLSSFDFRSSVIPGVRPGIQNMEPGSSPTRHAGVLSSRLGEPGNPD